MDRIFESGAAASPPSAPASPSSGYPTAGNPALAIAATKPGPWWYHMIAEEMMAIIAAASITPDHTDTNQLLDALRAAGVFQTAAQFDNTTKVATTAFVKRALGGLRGIVGKTTAGALGAADVGKLVDINAAIAMTLPAASSVPNGEGFYLHSTEAGASVVRAGADVIYTGIGTNTITTRALNSGEHLILISDGVSAWYIVGGSAALIYSTAFGASLGAAGYQKLPSGLIVQWGTVTTSASADTAVTFPITFPTAGRSLQIAAISGASSGFATYNTLAAAGFNAAGWTNSSTRAAVACSYLALGH
ncbi:MAG: putative phage tail protein [Proteobacteria bacterium]|nr:putative phage tail protein [Pseudomonadota bacterium]